MSESRKFNSQVQVDKEDSDQILDLNFVPQWARRPPDAGRFARFDDTDASPGKERGGRGTRDGRLREQRSTDDRPRRRSRPAGKDSLADGAARSRPQISTETPSRRGDRQAQIDSRPEPGHRGPASQPEALLPLNVRFLPERKALSDLIHRVSATCRAYALLDLSALLMSKEGFCYVKIDLQEGQADFGLYQCRQCRTLMCDSESLASHVVEDHVDLFFDVKEENADPPTGVFVCVAKCGYSGVLLGPPNHHGYAEAVQRVHAERYGHIDLETYRKQIRTSHNPEDVERWKETYSKRMVYSLKKTGEEMSWSEVRRYMRTEAAPAAGQRVRRAILTEKEAHAIRDPAIRRTIRTEWQEESRFPLHLSFALRAAFRHRGLHLFKAGRGQGKSVNFVTAVKPVPLDPENAVPEIREALLFLHAHPGCTRKEMVGALRPGASPDGDDVRALLQPIHWLTEKGHIIEFYNGTLSVPMSSRR